MAPGTCYRLCCLQQFEDIFDEDAAGSGERPMPIHRLLERSAFDPETITLIAVAFEDACQKLEIVKGDPRREQIARRIFECAQTGERNSGRLRDAGLAGRPAANPLAR